MRGPAAARGGGARARPPPPPRGAAAAGAPPLQGGALLLALGPLVLGSALALQQLLPNAGLGERHTIAQCATATTVDTQCRCALNRRCDGAQQPSIIY
jgi:hypothetical protein